MTVLRAVYTPGGKKADAVTWDIEFEDLTVAEIIHLEDLCDKFEPHIVASIGAGSKTDMLQLLYVWRQRTEPDLTWLAIEEMTNRDLVFSNPKSARKAAAPKGGSDPQTETPTAD